MWNLRIHFYGLIIYSLQAVLTADPNAVQLPLSGSNGGGIELWVGATHDLQRGGAGYHLALQ